MARKTLHLIVQQEEPSRDSLWINPYNGVARIYAQNKGWVVLQGPLLVQLNDKVDAEVATLTKRIAADEKSIQTNAEAIEGLMTTLEERLSEIEGKIPVIDEMTAPDVDTAWDETMNV